MNFVTIHDLSRELNIPERMVRYRFHQLRTAGKLIENEDYIRDDYVDDQHFTWKINPLSFMRESKTTVSIPAEFPAFSDQPDFGNQPVNKGAPVGNNAVNQERDFDNQVGNQSKQNPPNNSEQEKSDPTFEREMIDFLRERLGVTDEQLKTKDSQIETLSKQNSALNTLNIQLVGEGIRQSNRIQELLKIMPSSGYQTSQPGNPVDTKVNDAVSNNGYHEEEVGNDSVNDDFDIGYHPEYEDDFSTNENPDDMAA